ncbi:hypothetical protein N7486_009714 [Penicillium sp. IBT 16267x]|nr:hypothetical protein N7486_009714 [Penicillium sp. IBT 16267x]
MVPGIMLSELCLSDPPIGPEVGPSPLGAGSIFWAQASWGQAESQRLAAMQSLQFPLEHRNTTAQFLTQDEMEWLRQRYRNEVESLRVLGLGIFELSKRLDDCAILRELMAQDEENSSRI